VVEQPIRNRQVVGSTPTLGSIFPYSFFESISHLEPAYDDTTSGPQLSANCLPSRVRFVPLHSVE
jgi:hypothetical protein